MTQDEQDKIFIEWMRDYQGIFYKIANAFRVHSEVDDLVQEFRLAVWKSIPHFTSKSKPSTFIYKICLNRALSLQRRQKSVERTLETYRTHHDTLGTKHEASKPLLERIYEQIRKLDPMDRSIILLHLEDWSYKEIAEHFQITVNLVGVRLTRIKKKLTTNLGDSSNDV